MARNAQLPAVLVATSTLAVSMATAAAFTIWSVLPSAVVAPVTVQAATPRLAR